jgi:glutaredoxin 3
MPAHVRIYTTRTCPFCRSAERLLGEKNVEFEQQDVTSDPETRAWLAEATGQRTVPQIFINHAPVGGYSDLAALDAKGELDKLLAAEPVARAAQVS